jgi:hypothetical protein
MPASPAPDKGMAVRIPTDRGAVDCIGDLVPGLEAPTRESQGAQDLPPWLDQVEISRVFGLEHHLPARMRQQKQQHVGCAIGTQLIHDRVHPPGRARDPALNVVEEVDPIRTAPSWIGMRKGFARRRTKRAKDIAFGAAAIVDLLSGALGRSGLCPHQDDPRSSWRSPAPSSRQTTQLPAGGAV